MIRLATSDDHGEIFTLQRAAFVDEAHIYQTPIVPALVEAFDQLCGRLADSIVWVAVDGARIVGAVSMRDYRTGGPDIERLMVAPDRRGQGLASQLLAAAEAHATATGHPQLQLIVGDLALDNRAIYAHLGWVHRDSHTPEGFDHVLLHTLTKTLLDI